MADIATFFVKIFLVSLPIVCGIIILQSPKKRTLDHVLVGFLMVAGCFGIWQAWFDKLPSSYCATTSDFNILDKQGVLAAYFPGNDYRSSEARKLCEKMYVTCGADRYCTKTMTLGYEKW